MVKWCRLGTSRYSRREAAVAKFLKRTSKLTQAPLVLKRPPEFDDPRMSVERLERVALDEDVFRLALALDVLLVEDLESVLAVRRVDGRDVRYLRARERREFEGLKTNACRDGVRTVL